MTDISRLYIRQQVADGAWMIQPRPGEDDDSVEWTLRYSSAEAIDRIRFIAASMIESYDYMLSDNISMKDATRRLRLMRLARKAAKEGVTL